MTEAAPMPRDARSDRERVLAYVNDCNEGVSCISAAIGTGIKRSAVESILRSLVEEHAINSAWSTKGGYCMYYPCPTPKAEKEGRLATYERKIEAGLIEAPDPEADRAAPDRFPPEERRTKCQYCGKVKEKYLTQHETFCKENPNAKKAFHNVKKDAPGPFTKMVLDAKEEFARKNEEPELPQKLPIELPLEEPSNDEMSDAPAAVVTDCLKTIKQEPVDPTLPSISADKVKCPVDGCGSVLKRSRPRLAHHLLTVHPALSSRERSMLADIVQDTPEPPQPEEPPPIDENVPPLSDLPNIEASPLVAAALGLTEPPKCDGPRILRFPDKEEYESYLKKPPLKWEEMWPEIQKEPECDSTSAPVATLSDSGTTMTGSYDIKDLNIFRTDREWLSDRLEDLTRGARERNLTVKVTMEWSPLRADVIITGARP
ncbi:MAG: hypothetical protein A4E30_00302 [Methanomassiliicoccales archaeon PtaB.Bin215]|nr:MAG: hypothetical protein A4E30_00302 [Methanomassiliicoccales archaeon PtaB.Bin215]